MAQEFPPRRKGNKELLGCPGPAPSSGVGCSHLERHSTALRVTHTALLGDKRRPWHCGGGSRAAASALSAAPLHHICRFGNFFSFLADIVLRFVFLVQGLRKGGLGPGVGGSRDPRPL